MNRPRAARRNAGFLLLETMFGVLVFALGVLTIAKCAEQCLDVEAAKVADERVRMALENRMAEIEAGAVFFETGKEDELEGMFKGITLSQTRVPLPLKDEKKKEITGLYQIQLEANWRTVMGKQSKVLTFYVFQKPS